MEYCIYLSFKGFSFLNLAKKDKEKGGKKENDIENGSRGKRGASEGANEASTRNRINLLSIYTGHFF